MFYIRLQQAAALCQIKMNHKELSEEIQVGAHELTAEDHQQPSLGLMGGRQQGGLSAHSPLLPLSLLITKFGVRERSERTSKSLKCWGNGSYVSRWPGHQHTASHRTPQDAHTHAYQLC